MKSQSLTLRLQQGLTKNHWRHLQFIPKRAACTCQRQKYNIISTPEEKSPKQKVIVTWWDEHRLLDTSNFPANLLGKYTSTKCIRSLTYANRWNVLNGVRVLWAMGFWRNGNTDNTSPVASVLIGSERWREASRPMRVALITLFDPRRFRSLSSHLRNIKYCLNYFSVCSWSWGRRNKKCINRTWFISNRNTTSEVVIVWWLVWVT